MDYNKIIEHFAQKVDESRRDEFIAKASKVEEASEAEALGKEFGIVPDAEDRKLLLFGKSYNPHKLNSRCQ